MRRVELPTFPTVFDRKTIAKAWVLTLLSTSSQAAISPHYIPEPTTAVAASILEHDWSAELTGGTTAADPNSVPVFQSHVMDQSDRMIVQLGGSDYASLFESEYVHSVTDFDPVQIGEYDVVFRRVYRSNNEVNGPLGKGWTHSLAQFILQDGAGYSFHSGDGSFLWFTPYGADFQAAGHILSVLSGGELEVEAAGGLVRRFEATATAGVYRISEIRDRHSRATLFNYDAEGRLDFVLDDLGRKTRFEYYSTGRIKKVLHPSGEETLFGYDKSDNLSVVLPPQTVAGQGVYKYSYDASGNLTGLLTAEGAGFSNKYSNEQLVEHSRGEGSFLFSSSDHATQAEREVEVLDRSGNQVNYYMSLGAGELGVPKRIERHRNRGVDPTVPKTKVHTTTFSTAGGVSVETSPSGVQTEYWYDSDNPNPLAQGNIRYVKLIPSDGVSPARITWTDYESRYQKVKRSVGPRAFADGVLPLVTIAGRIELDAADPDVQEFQTLQYYDYEEILLGQDLNSDGLLGPEFGDRVRVEYPATSSDVVAPFDQVRYTSDGRVREIEDGLGYKTRLSYWPLLTPFGADGAPLAVPGEATGMLAVSTVDASGPGEVDPRTGQAHLNLTTEFRYDKFGSVSWKKDAGEPEVLMTRDARGRLDTVTEIDFVPVTTSYKYDRDGRLLEVVTPRFVADGSLDAVYPEKRTVYSYDSEGRLSESTIVAGVGDFKIQSIRYDKNGNPVLIENFDEANVSEPYSAKSQVLDELGQVYSRVDGGLCSGFKSNQAHSHIDTGQLTAAPVDQHRFFSYTDDGGLKSESRGASIVASYEHDAYGNTVAMIDAIGGRFESGFDIEGNEILARVLDSSGALVSQLDKEIDQRGRVERTEALAFIPTAGSPFVLGDGANTTMFRYDAAGNLSSVQDEAGHVHTKVWNGAGLLHEAIEYSGDLNRRVYNSEGQLNLELWELASPEGSAHIAESFLYDSAGRVTQSFDTSGVAAHTFEYDTSGNATRIEDRLGNDQERRFDGYGRVLEESLSLRAGGSGDGALLETRDRSREYSSFGKEAEFSDGEGRTISMGFDAQGRPEKIFLDGATAPTHELLWNPNNTIAEESDANGTDRVYSYDDRGLLEQVSVSYGVSSVVDPLVGSVEYERDSLGRLTGVDNGVVDVARVWDSQGRLVWDSLSIDGYTFSTTRIPSAGGGSEILYYPSGANVVYSSGQDRHLPHSISIDGDQVFDLSYVGEDRLLNVEVNASNANWQESWSYDSNGAVEDIRLAHAGAAPGSLFSVDYELDDSGQLSSVERSDVPGLVLASHDSAGQLTEFGSESFSYDLASNLISYSPGGFEIPIQVNEFNQIASVGAVVPTYDSVGNLTSFGAVGYEYDYQNRLRRIVQSGSVVWEAFYDGLGRRVKTVAQGEVKYFCWFEGRMVEVATLENGSLSFSSRVLGVGDDELLMVRKGGVDTHTIRDANGSVIAALDSSGQVVERYVYSAFGVLMVYDAQGNSLSGPTTGLESYYTGRPVILEGGQLVDLRSRFYRPSLARFLSRDPIGIAGGWNLYSYVGNAPLLATDRMGTSPDPDSDHNSSWEEIMKEVDPGGAIAHAEQGARNGRAGAFGVNSGAFAVGVMVAIATAPAASPIGGALAGILAAGGTFIGTELLNAHYGNGAMDDVQGIYADQLRQEAVDVLRAVDNLGSTIQRILLRQQIDGFLAKGPDRNGEQTFTVDGSEITLWRDGDDASGTLEPGGWWLNVDIKSGRGHMSSSDGTVISWNEDEIRITWPNGGSFTLHKKKPHEGWQTVCFPSGRCDTYDAEGKKITDEDAKPKSPGGFVVHRIPGVPRPRKPEAPVELAPVLPRPGIDF